MMGIEDENAALRQRVAELEAALERQHQNAANWAVEQGEQRARAEQAEKERDEALAVLALKSESADHFASQWHDAVAEHTAEKAARERAEADNAALLVVIDDVAWRHTELAGGAAAHDRAVAIRNQPHPGAALLERLRALEAVRETCEPWVQRYSRVGKPPHTHEGAMLAACAAADALKGKP